jgi:DNA-binding HxlR family transcriptional regulator
MRRTRRLPSPQQAADGYLHRLNLDTAFAIGGVMIPFVALRESARAQRAAFTVVAPLRCASIFAMPTHIRHGRSSCPVARSLDVLGDKWTLLIVREALNGTTRFSDFWRQIRGLAKTILSTRLHRLVALGRVRHHSDQRNQPVPRIRPHRLGTPPFPVVRAGAAVGCRLSFRRVRAAAVHG